MRHFSAALLFLLLGALPVQAGIILSTDFTDRAVDDSTAYSITWVANGVASPGNLTATTNPDGLFITTAAQGRFAPDRNLHNEGSWSVDILLALLGADIELGNVSLDALIFNNAGALQTVSRDLDLRLDLLDSSLNSITSQSTLNIFAATGNLPSNQQPRLVNFDLSGNLLAANTNYTLRLTAFGTGPGNNAGFDNLAVNGNLVAAPVPVPAPATLAIFAIGLLTMAASLRRRRSA